MSRATDGFGPARSIFGRSGRPVAKKKSRRLSSRFAARGAPSAACRAAIGDIARPYLPSPRMQDSTVRADARPAPAARHVGHPCGRSPHARLTLGKGAGKHSMAVKRDSIHPDPAWAARWPARRARRPLLSTIRVGAPVERIQPLDPAARPPQDSSPSTVAVERSPATVGAPGCAIARRSRGQHPAKGWACRPGGEPKLPVGRATRRHRGEGSPENETGSTGPRKSRRAQSRKPHRGQHSPDRARTLLGECPLQHRYPEPRPQSGRRSASAMSKPGRQVPEGKGFPRRFSVRTRAGGSPFGRSSSRIRDGS